MKDYYIGLDIGTNSVGWAVTDTNYSLCRFKGQDMWGVRLFEEANTAEERRMFRTARRRNDRKKERIRLIQAIFADEIAKTDNEFFLRLNESKFFLEDKKVDTPDIYFNDPEYKDSDYFQEYPTICHLKKAFLEGKKITDIRKLYLVIHHYMKNRGHFLFPSLNAEETTDFQVAFDQLCDYLKAEYEIELECGDLEEFQKVLKNPLLGKSEKGRALIAVSGTKDKQLKEILKLLAGSKVKFEKILHPELDSLLIDELKDAEVNGVSLSDDIEDKIDIIEQELGDRMELFRRIEALYNWSVLAEILDGEEYISLAKVKIYDEHAEDLKKLKHIIKTYLPKEYGAFFDSNSEAGNYAAYIGMTRINGKKLPIKKNCDQDEFCKSVKKLLGKIKAVSSSDEEIYAELKEKAENNVLLPKQISKKNSVIPYQVNEAELKRILKNASVFFPFLEEKDESGFSNREKIEKIFSFRIPYYVGPLIKRNDDDVAWIVRDYSKKILPWNFDEVVDKKRSAQNFIRRMTNKCTYLLKEDVLPKDSLLYSRYMVLNELNNLKIDGKRISVELKQKIFNDLFCKQKKVTCKRLREYLKSLTGEKKDAAAFSGIDGDFKTSLKSHIDFTEILGTGFDCEMAEEIILYIVLFGEERAVLKETLREKFGDRLSDTQIRSILKLKYSGWGRLSEKLLNGLCVDTGHGAQETITGLMWKTDQNFMEIYHRYNFAEAVRAENDVDTHAPLEELIEDLNLAPYAKRPVWQAVRIVNEIAKIRKSAPAKIFVEMARGGKENEGRKSSRKQRLTELYKNCKKDEPELYAALEKESDASLRKNALYLYYTQFGRSMYSGKPLPIESIYDRNVCDIDHIFPRSKIKDDSLNNKVLVLRTENARKSNVYPLPPEIRKKMGGFWTELKKKGLISNSKYDRLIRAAGLTGEELSSFVARQLVETRQSTKAIAHLLQTLFSDDKTEIVYVKAHLASEFRNGDNITRDENGEIKNDERIRFIKCREINDYHHAKDAYLNIVVGNVFNTKITHSRLNFIEGLKTGKYSMNRIYDNPIGGAWVPGRDGSMKIVCGTMKKNTVLFTRHSFEQTGGFFDQMPVKKGGGQAPLKTSDERLQNFARYGGYNKVGGAYFCVVDHGVKNKKKRSIESISIMDKNEYEANPVDYCSEKLGLQNPVILLKKLKYDSLIKVKKFKGHLSAKTGMSLRLKPAIQLVLSEKETEAVKKISKYLDRCANGDRKEIAEDNYEFGKYDFVSVEENLALYDTLVHKMIHTVYKHRFAKKGQELADKREKFATLNMYQQCFTIMQIIRMLRCTAELGDLHFMSQDGKSEKMVGGFNISKNINLDNNSELKVINQSVTGLFENEVNLLA